MMPVVISEETSMASETTKVVVRVNIMYGQMGGRTGNGEKLSNN